jgi:hypothetical protein
VNYDLDCLGSKGVALTRCSVCVCCRRVRRPFVAHVPGVGEGFGSDGGHLLFFTHNPKVIHHTPDSVVETRHHGLARSLGAKRVSPPDPVGV